MTAVLLPLVLLGQQATGTLKVHVLNVGQADAILIECPEPAHHTMVIDSGELSSMRYPGSPKLFQDQVLALLGSQKRIDVLVSTHPHSDHTGSLLWLLNTFEVRTFVDDGMTYPTSTVKKFTARAKELAAAGKLRYVHATDLQNGALDPDFCPAKNIDAILVRPREFGKDSNRGQGANRENGAHRSHTGSCEDSVPQPVPGHCYLKFGAVWIVYPPAPRDYFPVARQHG